MSVQHLLIGSFMGIIFSNVAHYMPSLDICLAWSAKEIIDCFDSSRERYEIQLKTSLSYSSQGTGDEKKGRANSMKKVRHSLSSLLPEKVTDCCITPIFSTVDVVIFIMLSMVAVDCLLTQRQLLKVIRSEDCIHTEKLGMSEVLLLTIIC
jgi:hypothetical protein